MFDRISGRGRNLQSITGTLKDLEERVTDIENTDKIIDQTLRAMHDLLKEIDYELRGTKGDNGLKSTVRAIRADIDKMHERNRRMDMLAARVQQMFRQYDGPERRQGMRGLKDFLGETEE